MAQLSFTIGVKVAIRVELFSIKQKKRIPAIQVEGKLSIELGEAIAEMLPTLLEVGTPLNQISTLLWGKQC